MIIDEASFLRLEVFSELHTLCQFDKDSKPYLPLILAGQGSLMDKLSYKSSAPLASRVVCRAHLKGLDKDGMQQYLLHHLKLAGVKKPSSMRPPSPPSIRAPAGFYAKPTIWPAGH